MALSYFGVFVAISLLLVPMAAKGDNDIHLSLSPIFDFICKDVVCGKGSCEAAPGTHFNFKCNCDQGWKRTLLEEEEGLEFLPCIVPDCEVDYSCIPAPPPLPPFPFNLSVFDPCYWVDCGQGTCVKNSTLTHTCECDPGYSNLLNISTFPCYNECAIGSKSCAKLGLKATISTSNPSANYDSSKAIAFSLGKLNWMAVLLATAAVAFWK